MAEIILVIHLILAIVLIGVVLLQRSEGGALGIGGGGGGGGQLFSGRGTANFLTRTTALLAVAFFATSITLAILSRGESQPTSVFDQVAPSAPGTDGQQQQQQQQAPILPQLPGSLPSQDQ